MGEMKRYGRRIDHYEQDRNWLKLCNDDELEDQTTNQNESFLRKILSFLFRFGKKNS